MRTTERTAERSSRRRLDAPSFVKSTRTHGTVLNGPEISFCSFLSNHVLPVPPIPKNIKTGSRGTAPTSNAKYLEKILRSGSRPMKCERSMDGLPGKSLGVGIVFSPPMVRQIHLPRIRIAMIVRAAFYVFQYFERIWGPTR